MNLIIFDRLMVNLSLGISSSPTSFEEKIVNRTIMFCFTFDRISPELVPKIVRKFGAR